MPSGEIRAGAAYVEAKVKDLTAAGISAIEARVRVLGGSISNLGAKFLVAGAGIAASLLPCIKAASDFNETVSQFGVVFGGQTDAVKSWADNMAEQMGRSRAELYKFLSVSKATLAGLDFDDSQANQMSKTIAQLAVDFGSFYNLSDEDAFTKIKSGLAGEAEPLKALGVVLNEAAVQAELFNQKIDPNNATEAQKVMARLNIILASTKAAQGDAVRTADQFANTLRRLQSQGTEAAIAIGSVLLPVLVKVVGGAADAAKAFGAWAAANPTLVTDIAALGGGLLVMGGALLGIGKGIEIFFALRASILTCSAAMQTMTASSLAFLATPLGLALAAVAVVAASIGYMAYKASVNMDQLRKATEAAGDAKKKLDTGDDQRKGDQVAIERLKQLNALQSLDADQKKEAATLVTQLNGHYDGLGISIDGTTGKVMGLAGAFETLAKAMQDQAIGHVSTDIRKMQEQLQAQRDARGGGFLRTTADTLTLGEGGFSGDKINAQDKEIAETMRKLNDAKARLAALKGGDASATTGDPAKPNDSTAKKVEEGAKQAKARADAEADAAKKLAELKNSLIQDEYNRDLAQINSKYDEEAKNLKALGADTKALEEARKIEQDQARFKAEERWKKERDDQKKTLQEAKEARDREAKEANDNLEERANLQRSLQKDLLEAQAKAADTNGDAAGADVLRKRIRQLEQEQENSDLEKRLDSSGLSEGEKQKLRNLQAQKQKTEEDTPTDAKVFKSQGTFGGSDAAIQSLQGGSNGKQKEIAKNTADTAKTLKKIADRDPEEPTFG